MCSCVNLLYFGPFNPFHYSLTPSLPSPFSAAFSIHPYVLCLHRCYVLRYCGCSVLFLFSFPELQSTSTVRNMFYIWVCTWSWFFCLCMCLSFGSIFYTGEQTCGLCFSEPGLFHFIWCPIVASIYLQTTCCHYSLWLIKLHCVSIPHFLDLFISGRVPGLFPELNISYCILSVASLTSSWICLSLC
jgi:hypothetical protein